MNVVGFQSIVGEKVCQFKGFMQQDAQEFMAFLLDGLHEVELQILIKNKHFVNGLKSSVLMDQSYRLQVTRT